jgi:hypothetical protein
MATLINDLLVGDELALNATPVDLITIDMSTVNTVMMVFGMGYVRNVSDDSVRTARVRAIVVNDGGTVQQDNGFGTRDIGTVGTKDIGAIISGNNWILQGTGEALANCEMRAWLRTIKRIP